MRKVLSFVLVLSLVLGSFGMAFAAPMSDVKGEVYEDAVNVLTELGVVSGYPDGTYKPANIVTRAEMAVITVRALGLADYAVGKANFKDMGGHWSNPYVAYATSLGIIAGYPDGTFKPDKTVSYDEAATMLVAALGYTPDSLVGTWPANYVTKAKTLGILDGIKSGIGGANRGDVALMSFQTLDQNIGKTDKDGIWVATVLKATGEDVEYDNMLGRLGAELFRPEGDKTKAGDAFVMTDELADNAVANVKAYIGAFVTAYADKDGDIIAIKDVKSTFLTGEFSADQDVNAVKNGAEFKVDDTKYKVDFVKGPVDTKAAVNADFAKDVNIKKDTEYTIAAKISGTKIKEVYSVQEWKVTKDEQVEDSDLAKINSKTPSLLTVKFSLDDNDKIDDKSYDLVGVGSLSDIDEDNVVYVYAKGNETKNDIIKIVVGTKVAEGEVTRIKGDTFTIAGKDYEFAANPAAENLPGVEDEITAYLDGFGKIYDYEAITKASNYAIVLATKDGVKSEAGKLGGTTAQVKLFLADGSEKTFDIDSGKYKDIAKSAEIATFKDEDNKFVWNAKSGDVVKYGVNKDGEINALSSIAVVSTGGTTGKISASGYFDGSKIASDAMIFTYDTIGKNKDEFGTKKDNYGTTTLSKVLKTTVEAKAWYDVNSSNVITFLYIPSTTSSDDKVYGVITDTEKNSSAAGYGVDLLVDGKEVFYNSEDFSKKDKDVLYLVKFGAGGDVTALDEQVGKDVKVKSLYRNVIESKTDKYSLDSKVVVYVWNEDDEVFEVGSTSDIEDGDTVVLYDVYGDKDGAYDIVLVK